MSVVETVQTFAPTPSLELDQPRNAFTDLVDAIASELGASGIDSEDCDVAALEALLSAYPSDPADWSAHVRCWSAPDAPYVRNVVASGNGKYNLVRPLNRSRGRLARDD
jgi:hypothetical protein